MLLTLVSQLKKQTTTQKFKKKKKKNEENNCDHDSYITTPESNKLTKTKFDERLKQFSKLSKQNDIADFMKEAYFNEKLRK